MCGIAGVFYLSAANRPPADAIRAQLQAMIRAMQYRGPDGEGYFVSPSGSGGFGHLRLAILDLKPTGAQPMADPPGRFTLIFNGEIYNFRALREELLQQGCELRSTGDTEVVLRLLMKHGPDALSRLRGMFALAYWDEQERTLLLARDRFGIKPMVYAQTADRLAFASEIKGLRASEFTSRQLDPVAFQYYLQWGSIPAPLTWLSDARSLLPGHWKQYRIGSNSAHAAHEQEGCFADVRADYVTKTLENTNAAELMSATRAAVEDSVRRHLESDVPVGVFLSGGIDSSSLVSAVRSVSSSRIQTYSITFAEAEFSEQNIAREVARRFETEHHELQVTAQHICDDLPKLLDHLDQPTNDGINSYYVSRAVAQVGLKVVLSGTGGDEFFGGYPSFRWLPKVQRRHAILRFLGPLVEKLQKPHRREKWRHLSRHAGDWIESYRAVRGLFLPAELPGIIGPRLLDDAIAQCVREVETQLLSSLGVERPLASVSRMEVKHYLGAQLLRDIDVMSMAHSLEVRVPLVDHELQRTLWPSLGAHPNLMRNKRLLYESLRQPLPPAVFNRPKQGFTFPFAHWIKHELRDFVREGTGWLAKEGWIEPRLPHRLEEGFAAGQVHWSRLWSLAIYGQMAMKGGQ